MKHTRHWRAGGSFWQIIDCATIVEERVTSVIIVEAAAVLNAKGSITQVFVTEMSALYSLCIRHQWKRHLQL